MTDTAVKVGFLYLANAGTVVGAYGVKGYSQGDEVGEFKALVADLNSHGGVAGRRVDVDYHDIGGVDQTAYQAACAYFTQDHPVFMVFSALGHIETLNACLAKYGVGYSSNYIAPPDRLMRGLRTIYAPDDIAAERYAVLLGRSLVDGGFFKTVANPVVGIYRQDTADYERITNQVLKPIFQQAGVKIGYEYAYDPTDTSEAGRAGTVVFQMHASGVTHVVSYESPLLLMIAAESQNWRPWWTVTSRAGPGSFLEGSAPQEQLKKSMGPGWQQVSDLATPRIPGPFNGEEARCLSIMVKAGHNYQGTPRYVAQMLCGEVFHFERVLRRATEFSEPGFRAAAESMPPYPSPMTFGMDFTGGRHDGASKYRMVAWRDSCSCFAYVSPLKTMPVR